SRATVSDAGPAPMQAMRLPFFFVASGGNNSVMSASLLSAATRFRRQIATGSGFPDCSSTRPRRLAGPVARAPQDPGKHVRLPIDHESVGVALRGDEADVFRHRRVRWARPL